MPFLTQAALIARTFQPLVWISALLAIVVLLLLIWSYRRIFSLVSKEASNVFKVSETVPFLGSILELRSLCYSLRE